MRASGSSPATSSTVSPGAAVRLKFVNSNGACTLSTFCKVRQQLRRRRQPLRDIRCCSQCGAVSQFAGGVHRRCALSAREVAGRAVSRRARDEVPISSPGAAPWTRVYQGACEGKQR